MYLVTVTFDVAPDQAEAFAARVRQQAVDSLTEPGCRRFDVWSDPANSARIFLYEIYDDRAAFDAHLESPHFMAFDGEVAPWIVGKQVETGILSEG